VAGPAQPAALVDIDVQPPLGIGWGDLPTPSTLSMPSGGVLVLYTDGLVERRGEDLDAGLARLCAAVAPNDPESVCRSIMLKMIGSQRPEDDVALVVLRRTDKATR
jgi:serine phosphatase RsbU (regulator of sigma subunit)